MPAFDIVELRLYCDRDWRATFAIYDAQGRALAIGLTDIVYAKLALSEGSATPVMDVGSDSPLTGGSAVTITTRGDTSAPDPANWIPAAGVVEFAPADTKTIPTVDAWGANENRKRYVFDLSLHDNADGKLKPFGRGSVIVHRSPGGKGT
jgi:hypothetical protein